jgi:uncharacterized protein (DUF488 family)
MTLFTIGFTRKTAEQIFEKLKTLGVKRVVDIRLNNTSQLAGFAKRDDLVYFLKSICGIDYVNVPELAPDKKLLELIKKKKGSWAEYEAGYLKLLSERKAESEFLLKTLEDGDCLLCSEHTPEQCHRRIVAERFQSMDGSVEIVHL